MKKKIGYLALILVIVATMVVSLTGCTPQQGLKGDKGDKGDRGEQGIQGIQGLNCLAGITGVQGNQGIQGLQGLQGIQGIQGLQGLQGTSGINGVSIVNASCINGNLVLTLSDGTNINVGRIVGIDGLNGVSVVNAHVNIIGNLILMLSNGQEINVGRVKGDTGLTGATGAIGAQGIQGIQGVKGDTGDSGLTYIENPFTGLATCNSDDAVGGSVVDGFGTFTVIGAASISGTLSLPDWVEISGHHYQLLTGEFTITSFTNGIVYTATAIGYQWGEDGIFAGTYTFTSGATGSGSITATIDNISPTQRILHISVYGTLY